MADKMFTKIQKLLALAGNNPNAEEAQSAMAKARALMVEYGLQQSDFEGAEQVEKNIKHIRVTEVEKNLEWWKRSLAAYIADNFRCFFYVTTFGKGKGNSVTLCGLEADVEVASQVFKFAVDNIAYNSKVFRKQWFAQWMPWAEERKRANYAVNDFIKGYLKGMNEVFKEQEEKNNWGLVLVKDALVEQAYNSMDLKKLRRRSVGSNGDRDAFEAGRQKGREFNSDGASRKRIAK